MIRLLAPAKVNLHLEVRGRRDDGFHEIVTVMTAMTGLADEVEVSNNADPDLALSLEGATSGVPGNSTNLAWQAADRLRRHVRLEERGARIRLCKNIPVGGGLGGGSSDAASVLLALDELWDLRLGVLGLEPIACSLGSDVPFFLHGGAALCRGRGEVVEPLSDPPEPLSMVIYCPEGVSCPTSEVYARWSKSRHKPSSPRSYEAMQGALQCGDALGVAQRLFNALEETAVALYPQLADAFEALSRVGLLGVRLSGSGSSIFGIAQNESAAYQAAEKLAAEGLSRVFVTCTAPRERPR